MNEVLSSLSNLKTSKKIGLVNRHLIRLAASLIVLFHIFISCSAKDDAEVIRQLVKEGAKLAESHDISGLMKLTAENFIADPGQHDHRAVRGILFRAFKYYGQFKIMYPRPSVDLSSNGQSAFIGVHFLVVKKDLSVPGLEELYRDPRGWLEEVGEKGDLYRLNLELSRHKRNWLVKLARIEPFPSPRLSGRF